MIRLNNVSKNYYSKKKKEINALYNINIEFKDKGFVCILGKSGSGKSTILNVLGALDKFDEGQLFINEFNTENYKQKDWDNYRGKYVGFIFQEFNLLEDLTVKENIALTLEILEYNSVEILQRVEDILNKVDLTDFGDRRVNELSGGQKQRVAIARALIKNPYLILADEPTGNLDSETSLIILNLLKDISKEKLVIMVTHDEEFANKFADRIIKLQDGNIVNDITNNEIDNRPISFDDNENTLQLPFKYALILALKSLLSKKLKLFFIYVLFIMSLIMMSFALIFTNFNFSETTYKTFKINNLSNYDFNYPNSCLYNCVSQNIQISQNISSLQKKYPNIGIYEMIDQEISFAQLKQNFIPVNTNYSAYIQNVVIYNDNNIQFSLLFGDMPQTDNEIIVTDDIAQALIAQGIINVNNIQEVVGQDIHYYTINSDIPLKISGLINTENNNLSLFVYLNNNNLSYIKTNTNAFNTHLLSGNNINSSFGIINRLPSNLANNSDLYYGNVPSKDTEVAVTLGYILKNLNISYDTFTNNKEFYLENYLNKSIHLKTAPSDKIGFQPITNAYTIVGVIDNMTDVYNSYQYYSLFFENNYFNDAYDQYYNSFTHEGKIDLSTNAFINVKILSDVNRLNYIHNTSVSDKLYSYSQYINEFKNITLGITIFISLFTSLLIYSFISNSIEHKKKDIGILRSLGLKGKDCSKIFILEGLIIDLAVTIIAILSSIYLINLMDIKLNQLYKTNIAYLYFSFISILCVIVYGLILTYVSSYIPSSKISHMKPIDAIKNK